MGVLLNDLPKHIQEQVRRKLAADGGNTGNGANLEPSNIPASKGNKKEPSPRRTLVLESKKQVQRPLIQVPVRIVVTFFRKRLPDFDGCPVKWVVDSLVESRVLFDDDQKHLRKIEKKYIKVETELEERTRIEIYSTKEEEEMI